VVVRLALVMVSDVRGAMHVARRDGGWVEKVVYREVRMGCKSEDGSEEGMQMCESEAM